MVQRVQVEPDRKGWGRLMDLYKEHDENRIKVAKEDIDSLLVFVRRVKNLERGLCMCSREFHRPVYFLQYFLRLLLKHIKASSRTLMIQQTRFCSKSLPSLLAYPSRTHSLTPLIRHSSSPLGHLWHNVPRSSSTHYGRSVSLPVSLPHHLASSSSSGSTSS